MSYIARSFEQLLDTILASAGTPNVAKTRWTTYELIEIAKTKRPGRLENVEAQIGKKVNWEVAPTRFIVDKVYGIDCVIDANGNGLLIAIDWTTDKSKVDAKVSKLKSFEPMWSALGICRAAVVLLVVPENFHPDHSILDQCALASMDNDFVLDVLFPLCEEPEGSVKSYTLVVPSKDN